MDKIKAQANKVGEILFAPETGSAYQKTLTLTWDIIRETAILLWLAVMLVFVGAEWFYYTSISLGVKGRDWYENLGKAPSGNESATAANFSGESLLKSVQTSTTFLLDKAREQLGVEAPARPAPKPPAAKPPEAAATPVSAPEEPTEPVEKAPLSTPTSETKATATPEPAEDTSTDA